MFCHNNVCISLNNMSRKTNISIDQIRNIIREEFALLGDEMSDSFKSEIADIRSKMISIDAQLKHTFAIKETVEAVEKAVEYTSNRLDDIYQVSFPALSRHVEQVAVGLAMQTLDLDVHRRKWTLTIQGLKDPADEDEDDTRAACVALARDHLQIDSASDTDLAACHRLGKRADSGIIVRFKDLKQRNAWLSGAKNLKKHPDKISVSQDLPPVLRPLKTELLGKRKDLPPPQKSKSNLRYLKCWPYIELKTGTGNIIRPSATREPIAAAVIGFNPLLPVPEPNT